MTLSQKKTRCHILAKYKQILKIISLALRRKFAAALLETLGLVTVNTTNWMQQKRRWTQKSIKYQMNAKCTYMYFCM